MNQEDKQQARKKRELRMRRWLTTLTWTLPVFSFGSFFAVWNDIAHAGTLASSTTKTTTVNSAKLSSTSNTTTNSARSTTTKQTPIVLFKIGSRGVQVSHIQKQLAQLGLFHHVVTDYYGSETASAVQQFQTQHQLSVTGSIDQKTLNALQKAVKQAQTHKLTTRSQAVRTYQHRASSYHAPTYSSSSSHRRSVGVSGSSSASSQASQPPVSQSQQPAPPVTSSSAS